MLTNTHIGEGVLAPNEPPRFDQIPVETHLAVAEMAEFGWINHGGRVVAFRYLGYFASINESETRLRAEQDRDQLGWFEQLLKDF